uniref:Mitochondrial import receptor subunit TOM7-1 n=1 Tax=Hyacinthus orientalis TaxID=82025 RepID=Q5YJM3_HYAOR|nr:unknown [Hyacinthus orientalis]
MAPRASSKGKRKPLGALKGSGGGDAFQTWKEWTTWAMKKAKVATHYGFIPLIIVIGMNTEPKPTFYQLVSPF